MAIVSIAVLFTVWSNVLSENAKAADRAKNAAYVTAATSEGATKSCKGLLRDSEGDRAQFRVIDSEAVRRPSQQNAFDVTLTYSFLDTYANQTRRDTYTCAARYADNGWSMKKHGT